MRRRRFSWDLRGASDKKASRAVGSDQGNRVVVGEGGRKGSIAGRNKPCAVPANRPTIAHAGTTLGFVSAYDLATRNSRLTFHPHRGESRSEQAHPTLQASLRAASETLRPSLL